MSEPRRVWVESEGDRVVVHVATGPRPWQFQLDAMAAAELAASLADVGVARPAGDGHEPRGEPRAADR